MDILAILEDHLGFIERFYNAAAEPFETALRKIDAGEEPFVPKYAPGDHDGPEYLPEWMEADECLSVVGSSSLGLLQKALHCRNLSSVRLGLARRNPKSRGLTGTAFWRISITCVNLSSVRSGLARRNPEIRGLTSTAFWQTSITCVNLSSVRLGLARRNPESRGLTSTAVFWKRTRRSAGRTHLCQEITSSKSISAAMTSSITR